MKLIFRFVIASFLLTNLLSCQNKVNITLVGNLHEGFRIARELDKSVLLVVGADGCGKCEQFLERISDGNAIGHSLERNFIVVYDENIKENIPAKITHCLAYPLPFVFDNSGELLAFGYPKEKGKTFSDTEHVGMGKFDFLELFHLTISQEQFKEMVGKNMQAYLCMNDDLEMAYQYAKESIEAAPYCYNLELAYRIGVELKRPKEELAQYLSKMKSGVKAMDRHRYAAILKNHFGWSEEEIKKIGNSRPSSVSLSKKEIKLGKVKRKKKQAFSFELINSGKEPVLIYAIRASCSCVDIKIPKKPILPNTKCKIEGVFESKHKGKFERILSIHTNSKQAPLKAVTLEGTVF